MDYFEAHQKEFEGESDRAAVILSASIIDELLRTCLIAKLVPVTSSTDELFDGANAPLGTFSSRIEASYRFGIISARFARDLHLIRKTRNDFAHTIHGCSFEDVRVGSRITELNNSHGIFKRNKDAFPELPSPRVQFLEAVSWMIFHLQNESAHIDALDPQEPEWGYSFVYSDNAAQVLSGETNGKRKKGDNGDNGNEPPRKS